MNFKNQLFKKALIISFAFFGIMQSEAQVSFKPGIRAGANFSHFTKGDHYYADPYEQVDPDINRVDYSTKTDFYFGFYGALKLTKYYTLQPEIEYSAQGSNYTTTTNKDITLSVDYLSFKVLNKFTFNDKFNIHLGPTLDFAVDRNFDTEANFDMAFVLGMGINFTRNFGIEGRVKKGIIPVVNFDSNNTNVVFSIGGNYTFD